MENREMLDMVNQSYEKLTEQELTNLGVVLGSYRSFRGNRRAHIAYVGMPITTGKRFYEVLTREGVKTKEELITKCGPASLFELVIKPNIDEGIVFADELGRREDLLFIAPSVFEAKKWRWTDDAYMALWYRVIGEMAGRHIVMDGWEYSYGGLREVFFSMLLQWRIIRSFNLEVANQEFGLNLQPNQFYPSASDEIQAMWKMRIFDANGNEIRLDQALNKAVKAIQDLQERGFECDNLFNITWKLMQIPFFSPFLMSADPIRRDMSPLYYGAYDQLHSMKN